MASIDTRLIAVDPGNSSGLAIFEGARLMAVSHITTKGIDPWEKLTALRDALKILGISLTSGGHVDGPPVSFVTEGQFLGRDVRAMVEVARNAAAWETCATIVGCTVRKRENPSTWQAAFGWTGRGKTPKWRRKQFHRVVQDRYSHALGPLASQIDVQCAALIGTVAMMRLCGWSGELDTAHSGFEWVNDERCNNKAGV